MIVEFVDLLIIQLVVIGIFEFPTIIENEIIGELFRIGREVSGSIVNDRVSVGPCVA